MLASDIRQVWSAASHHRSRSRGTSPLLIAELKAPFSTPPTSCVPETPRAARYTTAHAGWARPREHHSQGLAGMVPRERRRNRIHRQAVQGVPPHLLDRVQIVPLHITAIQSVAGLLLGQDKVVQVRKASHAPQHERIGRPLRTFRHGGRKPASRIRDDAGIDRKMQGPRAGRSQARTRCGRAGSQRQPVAHFARPAAQFQAAMASVPRASSTPRSARPPNRRLHPAAAAE